jgi:geranylgeranyl pyrophosphate synthase
MFDGTGLEMTVNSTPDPLFEYLLGECQDLGLSKSFLYDLMSSSLLGPVDDLTSRPSKGFRAELVELGFRLGGADLTHAETVELCRECGKVVELLHAGSLAIDDIEDGSQERRGQPALHRRYGMPIALNAGNWLYFWPLALVGRLCLSHERELQIYRSYHETMLRAHMGQALDVGVPIDGVPREHIYETCLKSLELKSGALTAFAIALGAMAAGADEDEVKVVNEFGSHFGIALQMFDDLGNLLSESSKRFEDLQLRRPSWIWACLAKYGSESHWQGFQAAVSKLPHTELLKTWLGDNEPFLKLCRERAGEFLKDSLKLLGEPNEPIRKLAALGERLTHSYG